MSEKRLADKIKQARLAAGRNWAYDNEFGDLRYTEAADFCREFVFLACEYIEATEKRYGDTEPICLLCSRTEPCTLRCPGPDGQPDPNAPLVCMFDPPYAELVATVRELQTEADQAHDDVVRLDWLEKQRVAAGWRGWAFEVEDRMLIMCSAPANLREAIDAAMKETP